MIKLASVEEYPQWLKDELNKKEFSNWVESSLYMTKLIEEKYPINTDDYNNIKEKMEKYGYVRVKTRPLSIRLKSENIKDDNYFASIYIYEVDETRPWTKIEMGEYSQILYLDSFECVDVVNNYYEINNEKNKLQGNQYELSKYDIINKTYESLFLYRLFCMYKDIKIQQRGVQ